MNRRCTRFSYSINSIENLRVPANQPRAKNISLKMLRWRMKKSSQLLLLLLLVMIMKVRMGLGKSEGRRAKRPVPQLVTPLAHCTATFLKINTACRQNRYSGTVHYCTSHPWGMKEASNSQTVLQDRGISFSIDISSSVFCVNIYVYNACLSGWVFLRICTAGTSSTCRHIHLYKMQTVLS